MKENLLYKYGEIEIPFTITQYPGWLILYPVKDPDYINSPFVVIRLLNEVLNRLEKQEQWPLLIPNSTRKEVVSISKQHRRKIIAIARFLI